MKKLLLTTIAITAVTLTSCNNNTPKTEPATATTTTRQLPTYQNADFYNTNGSFNEDKAKDIIIQFMDYYHYPITPQTKESLWVSDYGTGRYAELGLACIGYANDLDDGYMLQDLFLLPNQMLPEHWHIKINNYPAKLEGWLVRNGKSYIVGIGDDNLAAHPEIKIPACHQNGTVTVKNVTPTTTGQFVPLKEVLTHHWQYAGKEGAIITEVANGHINEAVRHLDKNINDHFLGN